MKHLRTAAIIAVIVLLFGLLIMGSSTHQSPKDQVWDEATTVGELDSPNYYIMYTDLMCPYCDVFSRAVMEHWDEFTDYLAENKILFEIRLTDALYEGRPHHLGGGCEEFRRGGVFVRLCHPLQPPLFYAQG